jgi:hypothetical protein
MRVALDTNIFAYALGISHVDPLKASPHPLLVRALGA